MIPGKNITLRALEDRDVEILRGWRNHPELRQLHFSTLPLSQAGQRRWYEQYSDQASTLVFIIENEAGHPIGYTLLKNLDHKNRQAEIGLHLDPAFQGQGYGTNAFRALIRFGFEELNLHRLALQVFDFNERAIRMYEKLGFRVEGRLREAFFTQGKYCDILLMSLLEGEWRNQ
ncbi:MAG: UDP-4-amino-4,6-dideoxy-N-acetyl-beta-L-altrosamine N-acetyltransferase [bacterium]